MSLDEMIITTSKKLGELQARVEEKSGLGNRYRQLVVAKLAYFKEKIIELLKKQKQQILDVKSESKTKMQGLSKTLTDLKNKEKQKGQDAMTNATSEQADMKNVLDESNKQIKKLQDLLNQPNPDMEVLKKQVDELNSQLQEARNGQAGAEAALKAAQKAVSEKEAIMDKSATDLKAVLEAIERIMKEVDGMSITNADLTEAMEKLGEIESILNQPENFIPPGDGGIVEGVKDLFEGAEAEGAAFVKAAKEAEKEVDKAIDEETIDPIPPPTPETNVPAEGGLEEVNIEQTINETPQESVGDEFKQTLTIPTDNQPKKKTRKERQELSAIVNQRKHNAELAKMLPGADNPSRGGKTRRRRNHARTIKKGGYVLKKKDSSRKMKKKKGKRRSSTSASSSSKKSTSS